MMIIENVIISKNFKKFRGGVLQVKKLKLARIIVVRSLSLSYSSSSIFQHNKQETFWLLMNLLLLNNTTVNGNGIKILKSLGYHNFKDGAVKVTIYFTFAKYSQIRPLPI